MVLVASPSATGRTPVAHGSSVPACPALLRASRRITWTTLFELSPSGLSMTSHPCGTPSAGIVLLFVAGGRLEVAGDIRSSQQGGNPLRLIKRVVQGKHQVRRVTQGHAACHKTSQKRRTALQPDYDLPGFDPAQRHHEDGRIAQIGTQSHLGDSDAGILESRVATYALMKDFGKG